MTDVEEKTCTDEEVALVKSAVDFVKVVARYEYDTIVACFCSMLENMFGEDAPFVADDIAKVSHVMLDDAEEK